MELIEQLLRQEIGLDAASVGRGLVERSIRHRMRVAGSRSEQEYARLLGESPSEWSELIEAVVVTETWFYRNPESFAAFARLVRDEWLPAHRREPLRVLSVPCASGEEPYSIVMALLNAGFPPSRVCVDAVDISARALERAEAALYSSNSFRAGDRSFRD